MRRCLWLALTVFFSHKVLRPNWKAENDAVKTAEHYKTLFQINYYLMLPLRQADDFTEWQAARVT